MSKIKIFITVIIVALACSACELERSSKGNLYGFWHLEVIDTLTTGTPAQKNLKEELIFWAFQSSLVELSDRNGVLSPVLYHFEHEGDSLFFGQPYYNYREEDDPQVEDISRLQPFGVHDMSPRLRIESLTAGDMVLTSSKLRLKFKKF